MSNIFIQLGTCELNEKTMRNLVGADGSAKVETHLVDFFAAKSHSNKESADLLISILPELKKDESIYPPI